MGEVLKEGENLKWKPLKYSYLLYSEKLALWNKYIIPLLSDEDHGGCKRFLNRVLEKSMANVKFDLLWP